MAEALQPEGGDHRFCDGHSPSDATLIPEARAVQALP
jgi:hypothetical protein